MLKATIFVITALWLSALAVPAAAQLADATNYRDDLNACLETDDLNCAMDVLINYGEGQGGLDVAVSVADGPTLLGAQMFALVDRALVNKPPALARDLAERAVFYALDAQPDDAYASGPYVVQVGEACLALDDLECLLNSIQGLNLLIATNSFFIKGVSEGSDLPDVPTRAANLFKDYQERTQ